MKLIEIQVVRDDEPAKICGAEAAEALEILRYLKIFYDAYGILWLSKPCRRKVLHEQFRKPKRQQKDINKFGTVLSVFSFIFLYIYICCTYTYILHTAHSLQQKGTRKRTRKSDENEVHFPRRPLRYGPKETTKIWASRGIAIWEDLSAYFTVLRLLEIDVLLPYFILPFFAVAQT